MKVIHSIDPRKRFVRYGYSQIFTQGFPAVSSAKYQQSICRYAGLNLIDVAMIGINRVRTVFEFTAEKVAPYGFVVETNNPQQISRRGREGQHQQHFKL